MINPKKGEQAFYPSWSRVFLFFDFHLIFFLLFCLSGLLTYLSISTNLFPYRMNLVSALVVPLAFLFKIRINWTVIAFAALSMIVALSGMINNSSLMEFILFMRILGFSFLIYFLVDMYVRPENIAKLIRLSTIIALVQLPIILLERYSYEYLPQKVKSIVIPLDFDFGSFNFKGDASMAIFLVFIVIFLLFDKKHHYIIPKRWLVIAWLTLTVLITNAEIVKLILLIVWGVYIVVNINKKVIIYSSASIALILAILFVSGKFESVAGQLLHSFQSANVSTKATEAFLSGGYGRGAAISYYIDKGITLFGDGPSKYYDPITRSRLLGNTGHIFTFYSEIGLLGWIFSVLIFLFIAVKIENTKIKISITMLIIFLAIQMLSFTTEIMNDVSIFMIYCIFAKSSLIPDRENTLPGNLEKPI